MREFLHPGQFKMAAPMAKCLLSTFFNTQMQNLRQITRVTTQVRQCMVATGPLSRQFSGISGCYVVKPSKYHFSLAHHVTLLAGERSTAGTSLSLQSQSQRGFASESGLDDAAVKSRMEDIADKFMEARDLLEDAVRMLVSRPWGSPIFQFCL